jgi:hypothetical protein
MNTAEPLLPRAVLEPMVTMREVAVRGEILRMLRSLSSMPAPVHSETVRQLCTITDAISRALQNDIRHFLAEDGDPELGPFSRDVALIAALASKVALDILERRGEWHPLPNGDTPAQDTLLTHALRHAACIFHAAIKWALFHGESVKATFWPQLFGLHRLVEEHLATSAAAEPSRAHIISTLMLDLVSTTNLSRVELEIADAWLKHWAPHYTLDAQFDAARHRLGVQLDTMSGLQLAVPEGGSSWRYLDATAQSAQIAELHQSLRVGRTIGDGVGEFPLEAHAALAAKIEKLNLAMFSTVGAGVETRERVENLLAEVALGVPQIHATLRGENPSDGTATTGAGDMTTASGLTLSLAPTTGAHVAIRADTAVARTPLPFWPVSDMSPRGIGFRVGADAAVDAAPGMLALCRTVAESSSIAGRNLAKPSHWLLVGIARKADSPAENASRIGAEIIARRVIGIQTRRLDGEASADTIFDPTALPDGLDDGSLPALYLVGDADDGRADALAFDLARLGSTRKLVIHTRAGNHVTRLTRLLKRGSDWVIFRFRVDS